MSLIQKFFDKFNIEEIYYVESTCKWYSADCKDKLCALCQFSGTYKFTPKVVLGLIKILAKNSITIEYSGVNNTWCVWTGMIRTNLMVYTLEDAIVEVCIQLGDTILEDVQKLFKGG